MPTMQIVPPKLHSGQLQVWNYPARFHVMACGRRFGKSRLGSLMCIAKAANGGRAWWVAPSYPMASIGWRMLKRLAIQIPGAAMREMDKMIELPNGGSIQVRSADNPDSLRGEGLDFVVLDECAFIKEDAWTEAIRPALADRQGGALFISTPKGRNWFWRLWQRDDGKEWKSWRFTSYDNPYVKASEIDAAKTMLPERVFAQEFLAEFLEDGGGVFRRVLDAATATPQDSAIDGHEYVVGVDLGKLNDFTVFTVIDTATGEVVYIDRFNQIDYLVQATRLQALNDRFRPYSIIVEQNNVGVPFIEMLYRLNLPVQPFTTTNATKTQAIDALALAFERGEIRIPNDAVLIAELQAYEMERLPSGIMRYSAPAGMHDDCVMSLALAYQGRGQSGSLLLFGG